MKISREKVVEEVKKGYINACKVLSESVKRRLAEALEEETNPLAKAVLEVLLENAELAQKENLPICQDTGIPVVWVKIGEKVEVEGLSEAINEGLKLAREEGLLRASVCDPLTRKNTGTNTPAVIHYELVPGEELEIWLMPKGCGSENMSALVMLSPSAGLEGVKNFVIETIKKAGPNPCPPVTVGVGIGGDFEKCALLAKKALFRDYGEKNPDPKLAELEEELLLKINELGIGPLGLGGKTTCLEVRIETAPCHIASLPVAVNVQCHAARTVKLKLA
jgi:fumarate hydratase subunit alpha